MIRLENLYYTVELQWGRRFSPTDTEEILDFTQYQEKLQWGRRFSPTDTKLEVDIDNPAIRASMGP